MPDRAATKVAPSVAELQRDHVTMELECIDGMYLNVYQPRLTTANGVAWFCRGHLGHRFASTKQLGEITDAFVSAIGNFQQQHDIPLVRFTKGQRKDDVFQQYLARFPHEEGVVFIGVAQEKTRVPRTIRKRWDNGASIPWIDYSTVPVNHYYFYCVDRDFGPFFLKFCSYFPYPAKLCLNGHEYLKRQLQQRGLEFQALDNGLQSCADLARAQRLADGLSAKKIDAFLRKWLNRLPHPFSRRDRAAGYEYAASIWQAEFSLTQVWDQGFRGRQFCEEIIRENIDLGRPEQVQLIFQRRMRRKTATEGRCRTRIITEGVTPSLHVYYKKTHLKQYHKEGRALRTETTINDSYDFGVGRSLKNLPALRRIGLAANRRVLEVQRLSHDCQIGAAAFDQLQNAVDVDGQHAPALRFGDPRVQALMAVLIMFALQVEGFRNQELRSLLAQHLGLDEADLTPGRMSYDLRRLRLHGLIERLPKSHRYRLTAAGLKNALYYAKVDQHIIRPGLSMLHDRRMNQHNDLARTFRAFDRELTKSIEQHHLQLAA